jgi:hypothetical protein
MSVEMISAVFERAAAKGAAWQVLLYLADRASADGTGAWPSVQRIVDSTNLTHRAVRRALAALERDEYIRRVGTSPYGTINWNLTPSLWPPKPTPKTERGAERESDMSDRESDSRNDSPTCRTQGQGLSDSGSAKPPLEPSGNPAAARELVDEVAALLTDLGPIDRTKLAAVIAAHPDKNLAAAADEIRTWGPLRSVTGAYRNALDQQAVAAALHERQGNNAEREMEEFRKHMKVRAEQREAEEDSLLAKALR